MIHKDSPPGSPEMEEGLDEDDLIYIGDVDEVLEVLEGEDNNEEDDNEDDEGMEKEHPEMGHSLCVFNKHEGSVFCGSLSKDGKLAVTGGEDDMAYVWDTASSQVVLECKGHEDSVIFAGFNFNDSYVATGDMNGNIKVWKVKDESIVWDYSMGDATWMHWHEKTNVLFAGSVGGDVYMWHIPDGTCKIFQGFGQRTVTSVLLADGIRLAVGYEDGTIRVMDLKSGKVQSSSVPGTGHSSAVTALGCPSNGKIIISAGLDGKTILRTTQTGVVVAVLQELQENKAVNVEQSGENSAMETDQNWVEAVAFCTDTELDLAATGTINGEIYIWDVTRKVIRHKISQDSGITNLVWKRKTSFLFSAGLDGVLRCYDARTGECVKSFEGHNETILDLNISADGTRILTTSDDSTARIFDITMC